MTLQSNAFALKFRMGAGFPGTLSRGDTFARIEANMMLAGSAPSAYGLAVITDAATGLLRVVAAGDTRIDGINIRAFPSISNPLDEAIGAGGPNQSFAQDYLTGGAYITVVLNGATPATKHGAVYVWLAASSSAGGVNHVQGGFEAAATAGSTLLVANAYFTGAADADGITEIAYET